ncbi:RcnB family protein [Comamonas sp. AG1104]|uniref:RcnB family protein n=1 Tax=Comamonas sp. AG1104 TaxID=2183900 RepID=UPI000E0B9819|nr:RcnB family protein [Comamonas sp. AG1104]RDI12579.1 Ni/Co efflux regulator RcnB [Comamonas sp. AG1104]
MSRLTTRILSASIAACLGLGSLAVQAQPGPPPGRGNGHGQQDMRHGGRHDDRGRHEQRYDRRDDRHADRHDNGRRGGGPDHNWYKGSRVPPQYRSQHYVVNDWRGHRLSAPPRGYHWIQNGGDYLLVAIATGVIASMVLGNY